MKKGDLIKHKKSALTAVIIETYEGKNAYPKDTQLVTVLFSDSQRLSTALLRTLEDNWEVVSEV